jgi:hypothetical protein
MQFFNFSFFTYAQDLQGFFVLDVDIISRVFGDFDNDHAGDGKIILGPSNYVSDNGGQLGLVTVFQGCLPMPFGIIVSPRFEAVTVQADHESLVHA